MLDRVVVFVFNVVLISIALNTSSSADVCTVTLTYHLKDHTHIIFVPMVNYVDIQCVLGHTVISLHFLYDLDHLP